MGWFIEVGWGGCDGWGDLLRLGGVGVMGGVVY